MLTLPDFKEKSIVLYYPMDGQTIAFKNDNLIIKDSEDQIVLQVTCYKLFALWVIGGTTLTTGILEKSKKFAFSIVFFSYYHRPIGVWSAGSEGNFILRQKQYNYQKIDLAKHLVTSKINNQIALLKSIRSKSQSQKDAISRLLNYHNDIPVSEDFNTILGLEGIASKVFFQNWFVEYDWKGRKPRIKHDITNCILDKGYTYLFHFIEGLLLLYGFDIYQGVYHKNFFQRKSLVCDLVEPFRCLIDKRVLNAYGLGQIKEKDFAKKQNQFFLKIDKNKYYSKWIMESLLERKSEIFTYVQSYYRCFMKEKDWKEYPTFTI